MAKSDKSLFSFDTAGWLFWFISFVVLAIPFNYLGTLARYEDTHWTSMAMLSTIGAAIAAACVSWAVNSVIQSRARKRRVGEKKTVRKKR